MRSETYHSPSAIYLHCGCENAQSGFVSEINSRVVQGNTVSVNHVACGDTHIQKQERIGKGDDGQNPV
jgi:hypothetical protein